jgi:hypothetical protein
VQQGLAMFPKCHGSRNAGIRLRRTVDTMIQMDLDHTRSNPMQRHVTNNFNGVMDSDSGCLADNVTTPKDSGHVEKFTTRKDSSWRGQVTIQKEGPVVNFMERLP